MEFKIGDRVKCIGGSWYDDVMGIKGTVVIVRKPYSFNNNIGVLFDEPVHYGKGHNLNGFLDADKKKHGYWINARSLELYKKTNKGNY